MSDSVLSQMIQDKIDAIIKEQTGKADDACKELFAGLRTALQKGVTEAVTKYRTSTANQLSYETALGSFIIEQNPYASWDGIDFPSLPLSPNGENPWVRRSGVLADCNALNPLSPDKPIPGGIVVNFSYVDWPELRDYNQNDHPAETPPAEAFIKPEAEVELTTKPVPFKSRFYPHNVVKAVRLRYTVFDRRYRPSGHEVTKDGLARDKQISYILVLYSGSDSN